MLPLFRRNVTIDGKTLKVSSRMTILEAARQAGIEIPTLCHVQDHSPTGVCRVCVVEVEGARVLVGSCHTPVSEGMVIHTRSSKVLAVRRGVVELMLAAHTGDCVNDPNADNCGLHNLASDCEVGAPRFAITQPRFYEAEEENPYVRRDLSKCILCRKCITACEEIAGKRVLNVGYRGFESKIICGYDAALSTEECRDCRVCISYCPTGALSEREGAHPVKLYRKAKASFRKRKPKVDTDRSAVLPLLKKELSAERCLSQPAMERVAQKTRLSLSETFGVSSFYAFLPREGNGVNRIRICQCVPCVIKDGASVIDTFKQELGISPGETTTDGRFSLEVVSCIGACDQAPALLINDDLFGNLSPAKMADILATY